jgi:hypothetical protein
MVRRYEYRFKKQAKPEQQPEAAGTNPSAPRQVYRNVMEQLVAEEVEEQLLKYPPRLTKFINVIEVETFALNRLPPLYASSEEGLHKQELRGRNEYASKIQTAVHQAFMAVQRDPLRFSTPLLRQEAQESDEILQALKDVLPQRELSLPNLVRLVKQALNQSERVPQEISPIRRRHSTPQSSSSRSTAAKKAIRSDCIWSDERYVR